MSPDEKAVAELFPCYEPNDIGECSPGGDHFKDCPANAAFRRRALALAARIRADAERETAAALARAERADALLAESKEIIRDGMLLHGCGDESEAACDRDVNELLNRYPHITRADPELLFTAVKAKTLGFLGRVDAAISKEKV